MATTTSRTTMATPTSAVALRRSRRTPWANGVSERAVGAGQATSATRGSSTSRTLPLPPLMGVAMSPSGVPDPRIQERVSQVHEQVDDHEGEGGDQREA